MTKPKENPTKNTAARQYSNCNFETSENKVKRRCSDFFSPQLSRRGLKDIGRRTSLRQKELCTFSGDKGKGRLIPVKQGFMFKKNAMGVYKRKYVTLSQNSTLTYYPSFKSFIENVDGKQIPLYNVTVKVPSRDLPSGIKTSVERFEHIENKENIKEDLSFEYCSKEDITSEIEYEISLISLDNKHWKFQVCNKEEMSQWERLIQEHNQGKVHCGNFFT